jgi:hypothetical protein
MNMFRLIKKIATEKALTWRRLLLEDFLENWWNHPPELETSHQGALR